MDYGTVEIGRVVKRISRFTVTVACDDTVVAAHLSNTGRNKELLVPGHAISIRKAQNPDRKTPYDIIAVQRDNRWINIDSLAPNRLVNAALRDGSLSLPGCPGPYVVHPETTYRDSRLDFAGHTQTGQEWFAETKGVTLANGTRAAFPDAPTTRGLKHVHTLTAAAQEGYKAFLVFVIQLDGIHDATIYRDRFPALAPAIATAQAAGVQVLAVTCASGPDFLTLARPVPFDLNLPFSEVVV